MKPIINIGLDADDFIFDTDEFSREATIDFFKKNYGLDIANEKGYNIKEMFECSEEQQKEFWKHMFIKYSLFTKPRPNFVAMLQALKSYPNATIRIHIITSKYRAFEPVIGKIVRETFELGLKIQGISKYIDEIHYCSLENSAEDKKRVCKENNIVIFCDDGVENIIEVNEITNAICMNTRNNATLDIGTIPRVDNFNQFYVEVMRIIDRIVSIGSIFTTFTKLDINGRRQLTEDELKKYFEMYVEYIKNLPFDKSRMQKGEDFEKILFYNTIGRHFIRHYNPIIIGRDNIPRDENVLFVSNHQGDKDFKLILSGLKDIPWHPLLKVEFMKMGFKGKLMDMTSPVYVKRENAASRSDSFIDMAKNLIHGGNLIIFPEGTYTSKLTTTDNVGPFSEVYCYLAQLSAKKIVPLSLTQDYDNGLNPVIRFDQPRIVGIQENIGTVNNQICETISEGIEKNKRLQLKI